MWAVVIITVVIAVIIAVVELGKDETDAVSALSKS